MNEKLIKQLADVLVGYEDFEAELISDSRCWEPHGTASYPRLTPELYDKMMDLQRLRNEAIKSARTVIDIPKPEQIKRS